MAADNVAGGGVDQTLLPGSTADVDLTIWGLIGQADAVVQVVLIILLLASFWSWAIIIDKTLRFRRLRRSAEVFEKDFWQSESLEDLYEMLPPEFPADRRHPMEKIFAAGMKEWRRSAESGLAHGHQGLRVRVHQRIDQAMQLALDRELDGLQRYLGFLASVGSTAPFLGLFGTVWGIMNSFRSIAMTKSTSLTVVAPGIAEALIATAFGLVAAIPAVVAYNKLSSDLDRYDGRLDAFSAEFSSIVSRHLEERSR